MRALGLVLVLGGLAQARGSEVLETIPAHVVAPDGALTLVAHRSEESLVDLYLVNRTDEPVRYTAQDGALPLVMDVAQGDEFVAATTWGFSTCGNSYAQRDLKPGHTLHWRTKDVGSAQGQVRFRMLSVKGATSNAIAGNYRPDGVIRARYDRATMHAKTGPELVDLVLGRTLPDLDERERRNIRFDALAALNREKLSEVDVPAALSALLRDEDLAEAVARRFCHWRREDTQRALAAVLADPEFPNRRDLIRQTYGCMGQADLIARLEHPDPELDVFVERLLGRLRSRWTATVSDALARFADNADAPDPLRRKVRGQLRRFGRDVLRVIPNVDGSNLGVELDLRTERPAFACASTLKPCVRYRFWTDEGELVDETLEPSEPRAPITTPVNGRLFRVEVPDTEVDRLCYQATPAVRVDGLEVKPYTGALKRDRGRWTFDREPCRAAQP